MTDYKTIRGKKIKFFTSDLSNAQAEGQIYYVNYFQDTRQVVENSCEQFCGQVVPLFLLVDITVIGGSTTRDAGIIFGEFLSLQVNL